MTQTAVVKAVRQDGYAECSVDMQTACGHRCADCGGACAAARQIQVLAKNPLGALPGEAVTIASSTRGVMRAAVLVYLLPLLALFAGYTVSALLGAGEPLQVAVSVLALLGGCGLVALLNRYVRGDKALEYEIVGKA